MPDERLTDPLTGVLNREGFFEKINPMAHLSRRNRYNVGLLLIDIDNLRAINEQHGRDRGDGLIVSIAEIIKAHIRSSDIVGRYSDGKFIVFLPQVDSKSLYNLANSIRTYIEMDTMKDLPATVSIGASQGQLGKQLEKDLEGLLSAAEDSLVRAKEAGMNRVVLDGR